ncbi:hypothetical protein BOTBODRAFT_517298 [Botryobasidium botryosum FD-172 SS1]|uniref:Uncharacterized protein n=1 Tax=Botryobasidium botryosum (strain FD-172 SS1) TaxID=930990 RepID=A0A067N4C5_BOTB1|nr:hypothetical protein BOTBODRAFT_517298 [Botryobasidium botryosum FD-172 SS1]
MDSEKIQYIPWTQAQKSMSPSNPEYQQIPLVIDDYGRTLRTVRGVVDLQMPDAPAEPEPAPAAETKGVAEDSSDGVKSKKSRKGKGRAPPAEATTEPPAKGSKASKNKQKVTTRSKTSKKTPEVLPDDIDETESEHESIRFPSPTPSDGDGNGNDGNSDGDNDSNTRQPAHSAQPSRAHHKKEPLGSSQYGGGLRGSDSINIVAADRDLFGDASRAVQLNQSAITTRAQSYQPPSMISAKERGITPASHTTWHPPGQPPRNTHTFSSSQPASRPIIDPHRYNLNQSSIWSDNHGNPTRPSGTDMPAIFNTPFMSTHTSGPGTSRSAYHEPPRADEPPTGDLYQWGFNNHDSNGGGPAVGGYHSQHQPYNDGTNRYTRPSSQSSQHRGPYW